VDVPLSTSPLQNWANKGLNRLFGRTAGSSGSTVATVGGRSGAGRDPPGRSAAAFWAREVLVDSGMTGMLYILPVRRVGRLLPAGSASPSTFPAGKPACARPLRAPDHPDHRRAPSARETRLLPYRRLPAGHPCTDRAGRRPRLLTAFEQRYNATAQPFKWKFTPADLKDLLARIERHEQKERNQQHDHQPATLAAA
jgi:hypothetical protein